MALRGAWMYEDLQRRKFSRDFTPTLTLPLMGEGTFRRVKGGVTTG